MIRDMEICDPIMVNRFFDKELDAKDQDRVHQHILGCIECRRILDDLKATSQYVNEHLSNSANSHIGTDIENHVLEAIHKKELPWWSAGKLLGLSKKVLIPATTLACLILITYSLLRTTGPPDPSAIITSLSGDTSSVIIFETPKSNHTIVWFTEDSAF